MEGAGGWEKDELFCQTKHMAHHLMVKDKKLTCMFHT